MLCFVDNGVDGIHQDGKSQGERDQCGPGGDASGGEHAGGERGKLSEDDAGIQHGWRAADVTAVAHDRS